MSKLFVNERRDKILNILETQKRVTVKELSSLLDVSEATLRTDLKDLEKSGLLQRTHGGATIIDRTPPENRFSTRAKRNIEEKMAIGRKAAELIERDQCIILDASTTAIELAKVLKNKDIRLTAITNGVFTALELRENPQITTILIGGILRIGASGIEGSLGVDMLEKINVDIMFTSASGFTIKDGLTDFNVYEVDTKRAMAKSAGRIVALLDYSKLGKDSIATFAHTDEIDTVITDNKAPEDFLDQLRRKNINVLVSN
jgi:Transcriptional regulators of sugar metabolism